MTGKKVVELMESGHRLFWGCCGPFLTDTFDGRCRNVHLSVARSLARKRIITKHCGDEYRLTRNKS